MSVSPARFAARAQLCLLTPGLLVCGLPAEGQEAERSGLHHQDHPQTSPILAAYDFEQPGPSGPDTFWVRQRDGGAVALSDAFRVSGERSLHISEVPGNRDFAVPQDELEPELRGSDLARNLNTPPELESERAAGDDPKDERTQESCK